MTSALTNILSVLTITVQAGVVIIAIVRLVSGRFPNFLTRHAMTLAWVIALVAMLGSLFYSEYAGYTPCKLCWFQRIAMYPLVIVLGLPLLQRERRFPASAAVLAAIGFVLAGYHYLLQLGVAPALPCSAVGYSSSCSERFVMTFGYITIPLMSFSAFAAILGLVWSARTAAEGESLTDKKS